MQISIYIPIYIVVILSLLSISFSFVSGYSKEICDLSADDKIKESLPKEVWVKKHSSYKKYNTSDGKIKAWLRKNLLVIFADKWHQHQFYTYLSYLLTDVCCGILMLCNWYFSFMILLVYQVRSSIFHFYYHISKKYRKL